MGSRSGERTYHSPLREAQAEQTRNLILDTLVGMLASGSDDVSTRALAREADVSERTVYRYFPDRAALFDGLTEHLNAIGEARRETDIETAEELAEFMSVAFQSFDDRADVMKASILLNPDPARYTPSQRRRTEMMIDIVRRSFPELSDADQVRLGQTAHTVASSFNWLRMREEFGMAGQESGRLLGWVLSCAFAEVRRTGRVGPPSAD